MTDMTREQIEALCEALPGVEYTLNCWEWPDHAETVRQALTAIRQLQRGWMGIESMDTAPRDRTHILAKTLPRSDDWANYGGRWFVIWHVDDISGWSLFPGMGVGSDWFEGWMPLPLPPAGAGC